MKQYLKFIRCMHLDHYTCLLTVQNMLTISYFFGILDFHEMWSINDIQFWMCMARFTNLEPKNIMKFFEMMDFHETGEMEYAEFYLWVCLLIAVKDRQEKQFMMCHLRTLTDVIDEDMSGSLTIPEFMQLGTLLNFKMSTMERVYDTWDWELSVERDKIKYYRIKFLIMTLIDEERGWEARRRVIRWKKYKRRYLFNVREPLFRYINYQEMPSPHVFWEGFQDTELPTFEKKLRHGCCHYFWKYLWWCLTLPCRIPYWFFYCPWKYLGFYRKSVQGVIWCIGRTFLGIWRAIGSCLACIFCKCCSRRFKRRWAEFTKQKTEEIVFELGTYRYYHRHESRVQHDPVFAAALPTKLRKYEHFQIWEQPWVSDQLAYERHKNAYFNDRLPNIEGVDVITPPATPPLVMRPKDWAALLKNKYVSQHWEENFKPMAALTPDQLREKKTEAARKKQAIADRIRRHKTKHHNEDHMLRKKDPYDPHPERTYKPPPGPKTTRFTNAQLRGVHNPHYRQEPPP